MTSAGEGPRRGRFAKAEFAGSLALATSIFVGGCASIASLASKWSSDLVSAASQNYSPQYSSQLEKLLAAVHLDQAVKRLPGGTTPTSATGQYPPYAAATPAYPDSNYPQQNPYGSPQVSQGSGASPYPAQPDPYSSAQSPYPQAGSAQQSPYGAPAASAIVLDVAVLAQRASERAARRTDPVPIQDGETLRDGGSDPRKGDVVKFSFRANCDCYVYVIAIDATGYVARVFPEQQGGNPVRANQQYVAPQGTAWYGLDQYKGTEQIFFIASRQPRPDIENSLSQLAKTDRSSLSRNFRPVREAAVDPATRGLVRVQMGTQSSVRTESGQQYSFTPQAFAAQPGTDDVAVTRWFRHE